MAAILVVEDNFPVGTILRNLLEDQKTWTCEMASNGTEAIERYESLRPDVALIDFRLPDIDGLQAARTILRAHPDAAILLVTAYPTKRLIEESRRHGIRGFCSKSDIKCVVEAVAALLDGQEYFKSPTLD
ncbi:MAG TPA: response regulator transcription factor, partial [Candidatus Saccharimonadales bacterium]|nr:response regulator transcription factor [Candidatus Saccharimonadales bacterium]